MRQNKFLEKIFPNSKSPSVEQKEFKDIGKFVDCFHNFTGRNPDKTPKGILPIKLTSKELMPTHPPRKVNPKSQIIAQRESIEPMFRVESLRAQYEPRTVLSNGNRYFHTISLEKSHYNKDLITPLSEAKIKGYSTIEQNIETLPLKFVRRSMERKIDSRIRQKAKSAFEGTDSLTRSKNFLEKVSLIPQKETFIESPQMKKEHAKTVQSPNKAKCKMTGLKKNMQELAEEERKLKLEFKKQISEEYAKPFNPPANITAASYIIFEPNFSKIKRKRTCLPALESSNNGNYYALSPSKNTKFPHSYKVIASLNSRNSVQVASLTKIMTCIVALELCAKYGLDASQQKISIGKFQSNIVGTSAQISEGEIYTLKDLYYGLMLPSGNDASIAIAVWGGKTIMHQQQKSHKKKQYYGRFIEEMNKTAKKLGMAKTNYANSHGLVNSQNRSCAYDIAVLCEHAMNNQEFREIVSCRVYKTLITYKSSQPNAPQKSLPKKEEDDEIEQGVDKDLDSNEEQQPQLEQQGAVRRQIQWENTHKLLQQKPDEYIGIKTGITNMAGPCLASCIRSNTGRYFIIVVLNCDRLSMRFKDTENLKRWLYHKQGIVSPRKKPSRSSKNQPEEIEDDEDDL